MRKISLLGQTALGSAVFFGAFAVATPAFAQSTVQPGQRPTQEPAEEVSTTNQERAEAEAGEACPPRADGSRDPDCVANRDGTATSGQPIVVTGSRIRLPNLESNEPIITVDKNQIQERTFTNVADALNELPIFRGSVTPAGAQGTFGQGVNFVNQYGLGSNRTLTLINGRRFVSSNTTSNFGNASAGTQVDLNVVPTIWSIAATISASAALPSTARTPLPAWPTSSCAPNSKASRCPASAGSPRKATISVGTGRFLPAATCSAIA
jgi:hypothetical protein